MKSMTGYGEATGQSKLAKIAVQLRTLNHRHLDLQLRLPREYLVLEEEIRARIRQKISRGRVELFITRSPSKGVGRRLALDEKLGGDYLQTVRRARKKFALKGEMDLALFFRLPELVQFRDEEVKGEEERGLVSNAVDKALGRLERSRQREGLELEKDIRSQVRYLRNMCAQLANESKKISLRLKESLSLGGEGDRVEAGDIESAGHTNFKGDIHEEIVRFQSHVTTLAHLLRAREPIGKKIDFLLQEIQRELNTMSSKAPHLAVVRLVLAGKERAERIREQIQNIE
ncbi:MAG: YicC/YloC family endoribonuclease [Candidatus Binatia bacterium]